MVLTLPDLADRKAAERLLTGWWKKICGELFAAVLFEVGFIPNPEQYEACADWETICETASGLAEGLLRSVPR